MLYFYTIKKIVHFGQMYKNRVKEHTHIIIYINILLLVAFKLLLCQRQYVVKSTFAHHYLFKS